MPFVMFDSFINYGGWQMKVIDTCQKFFEKYERYPDFIRMKEKTMDKLFDECEAAYKDPYSEKHILRDAAGAVLIPLGATDDDDDFSYYEDWSEDLEDSIEEKDLPCDFEYNDIEDNNDECIYPVRFGPNPDETLSFITNKFELKFLEGEDLPEDYYIVQFGDGPDDGGEDIEEDICESVNQVKYQVA